MIGSQSQARFPIVGIRAVAAIAVLGKDGTHLPVKVDFLFGRRGSGYGNKK